jgi:hypothetical protein
LQFGGQHERSELSFLSVHRPEWRRDRELSYHVDNPQPNRHASEIAFRRNLVGSFSAFQLGGLAAQRSGRTTLPPI